MPARLFESLAEADRPLVETVFRALVSGTTIENAVRFLTPPVEIALRDDTAIDLSPKSLIRQWGALRDWVRQEFESAQRYRHLETSAQLWAKGEAGLLRRPDLDVALDWRQRERPSSGFAARYGGDWGLALRFLNRSKRQRALRHVVAALISLLVIGSSALGAVNII